MCEGEMTKLEVAAYDYMREHRFAEGPRAIDAYVAGARWALEQMTSEAVWTAAMRAYGDFEDGESDEQKWGRVFAAVRKEIEG
jgi:hypothetical protein